MTSKIDDEISPRILYVFDEQAKKKVDWPDGGQVVLCPITTDYRFIDEVVNSIRVSSAGSVSTVNYAKLFNAKAFAIRDDFVKFMAAFPSKALFGQKSLKEYFMDRRNKFSLWWLTPIAEKNTVATASFDRLVALLTIIDIYRQHDCHELWLDIEDGYLVVGLKGNAGAGCIKLKEINPGGSSRASLPVLRAALTGKVQFGKLVAKTVTARWAMRGTKPVQAIKNAGYLIVSYFPFFNEGAWSKGKFHHTYFEPLQLELEKKHPGKLAWLAMFTRRGQFGWRRGLELGRQVDRRDYPFAFIEQWLKFSDLLAIAAMTVRTFIKFARHRSIIKRKFVFSDKDVSINIWSLFESDWYDSFCGRGLVLGLGYYRMFRNVFQNTSDGAMVIYTAEMLAWEKALNLAAKERSHLRVVGIQHTAVPKLLLTYALDKSELRNGNMVTNTPRPDFLACVGDFTSELFIDSGWDESRVFPWVALRHTHISGLLKQDYQWSSRQRLVVVALSSPPNEAKELLDFVWQALQGMEGTRFVIKAHPICPIEPLLESLKINLEGSNFEVSDKPLYQFLPMARALVVAGSSVGLESLACGCPVVIPRLAHSIDRNALSDICDLPIYANSPAELKTIIKSILIGESSPISVEKAQAFVRNYLSLPEPDEGCLASLEKAMGG